jgi:hypothetical protein
MMAARDWRFATAGGALGGLVVGALVKLLGIDAFNLLFGRSPAGMTGALEGALLGAAVGLGIWAASRMPGLRRSAAIAAGLGASAGIVIPLLGGRLMGGSLVLLARTFPDSRLRLDQAGELVGEDDFGSVRGRDVQCLRRRRDHPRRTKPRHRFADARTQLKGRALVREPFGRAEAPMAMGNVPK